MNGVTHDLNETELFARGDTTFDTLMGPLGSELLAISSSETTEVRYASTRKEDIADQLVDLVTENGNCFSPTNSFVSKKHDKLLSSSHAALISLHFGLEITLLILQLASLEVEFVYLFLGSTDTGKFLIKDRLGFLGCFGYLRKLGLFRHNVLVYKLVIGKGGYPCAHHTGWHRQSGHSCRVELCFRQIFLSDFLDEFLRNCGDIEFLKFS